MQGGEIYELIKATEVDGCFLGLGIQSPGRFGRVKGGKGVQKVGELARCLRRGGSSRAELGIIVGRTC